MQPRARLSLFVASSSVALGCGVLLGCSETPFDLLSRDRDDSSVGRDAGGDASFGGSSSGGRDAGSPTPIGDGTRCATLTGPRETRLAIQNVHDGGCLEAGESATANDDATQSPVSLTECDDGEAQIFTLIADDSGWFEIRSLRNGENLDVQLASPADGTLVHLYSPHQLYNQDFAFRPTSASSTGLTQIAARHAPTQCLTVRDGILQIQPCAGAEDQVFRLFACTEPAPSEL